MPHGHVEQRSDPARQSLQKPDVRNRGGEFDMSETFAPYLGLDYLDPAFVADDPSVLHSLVFAA